uniref:Uncharacterized protein n=1 Tax=Meloidogyne enterolobii TaxID=390850 RepID=A0A6V7TQF3_MELEN|nr:unnamed protein product [Meloidogyne enterolobii]
MLILNNFIFNLSSKEISRRAFSISSALAQNMAGKYKNKACRYLRGKPQIMTYDMSRLPSDIAVSKSWMTWHTQNLDDFKQQLGLTVAQDEIIRRFVRAIFYTYLPLTVGGTELITKRRGNVVYVTGFLIPKGNMEQIYWLYGFTEEILSNLLKQPVKLELQFIRSADDLAVEYFVQPTTTP